MSAQQSTGRPSVFCVILHGSKIPSGCELLIDTLDSVRKMTYQDVAVVVVDNASTDGGREVVKTRYPWVTLIQNGKDLGFGPGNNVGIAHALERGADWVFLLNDDVKVDPELLTCLMKAALTDSRIGMLSPKIYYYSQPTKFWYAGGRVNYFTGIVSHRGLRQEDKGQYDRVEDTEYITGCAMLLKRELLERVGMFDPAYFPIYAEDADLSARALRSGYRLVYVPEARMWHKVSASSGGGMTAYKTQWKVEHNLIFFRRYARWYHWLTIPWCVGAGAALFVARELLKGNFKIIFALCRGFMKALGRVFS